MGPTIGVCVSRAARTSLICNCPLKASASGGLCRHRYRALYYDLHRVHEWLVLAAECTLGRTCSVQFVQASRGRWLPGRRGFGRFSGETG